MDKMNKKELKRVKNAAFNLLKDHSSTAVELEYHLENIARAMSTDFDWLNPESNVVRLPGAQGPYVTDWTKPLPMVGKSREPKIPYHAFFNTDLELLQHGSTGDKKYVTSITLIPAARYLNNAIEEEATHLFVKE